MNVFKQHANLYRINKETAFLSFLTMEKKSFSTDFDLFRLSHGVVCKFCWGDLAARKFCFGIVHDFTFNSCNGSCCGK